jgi:hypothetical protein
MAQTVRVHQSRQTAILVPILLLAIPVFQATIYLEPIASHAQKIAILVVIMMTIIVAIIHTKCAHSAVLQQSSIRFSLL